MDGEDRNEHGRGNGGICRLEWIAWAMEAAREHRQALTETPTTRKHSHPMPPLRAVPSVEHDGDRA